MRNRPAFIPALIAAALLLVAIAPLPDGYYSFMRWSVMIAAIAICIMAYKTAQPGWLFLLIPIGIVFNPVAAISMSRESWAVFDAVAAVALLVAGSLIKEDRDQEEPAAYVSPGGDPR